ncbi:MAG: SDR family NAD(P)-dependent oxidoreductase [Novosphingobium sp.]|nr:SDR family NAD(P)-dependent oxidoreductase [Novosphingobium sp.]
MAENRADAGGGILEGKVAVITGAGQGIGRACVDVFLREGAKVLAVDFSGVQDKVAAECGPNCVPFHADVSKEDEIEAMYAAAIDAFGRVDASVQVAGTQGGRTGPEFTAEEYDLMTATNLRGVMFCIKHAARAIKQSGGGGSIMTYTSVAGIGAEQMAPIPYTAAKTAVHGVSRVFAIDYAPDNIRVNVIACGFTKTEMMDGMDADTLAHMEAKPLLGRAATPREQAEVAAFLASDRSSYITGTVIPVDGGWTARLV